MKILIKAMAGSHLFGTNTENSDKDYKGVFIPDAKQLLLGNYSESVSKTTGDSADILCGNETSQDSRAQKGVVELLWDTFGGTVNEQGYKVLNPSVGAIYGDAITIDRCTDICERLKAKGFASTNVVYGIGSFTYQYQTRDSLGFAMKATSVTINGVETPIFKNPKTDDGTKKSAKGRVEVCKGVNELVVFDSDDEIRSTNPNLLSTIFENGKLIKETTLAEIRGKLSEQI